jgi:hypothetical protein
VLKSTPSELIKIFQLPKKYRINFIEELLFITNERGKPNGTSKLSALF